MKYGDPVTGKFEDITIKVSDTSPIGIEAEYNGTVVPNGWEEVDDVVVTENVVSRNLYNKNNSYRIGAQNQDIANDISLKPNTDYCFNTGKTWTQATLFNVSGEVTRVIGGTETTNSIQFTTTSNEVKGKFQFYAGTGTDTETYDFTGIQLEKGTSATNYTPYLNMQELEKKTRITSENIAINDFFTSSTKTITDYSIVKTGNIINIQRMVIPSIPKGGTENIAQVNPKYKPKGGKPIRILASVGGGSSINGILFIDSDGTIDISTNVETANLTAYIFNATYIIDEEATI